MCVGNTFALMEAAIILAAVGQRYRFTLDSDAVIGINLANYTAAGQRHPRHPRASLTHL